jgi:AbrB family looped-hinge helix DNA binding protein
VSRRGASLRITLPKGIREKLGLKEGDIVGFYEDNSNIIIRKIE